VELGAAIVRTRVAYLAEIRSLVEENFAFISGAPTTIDLIYEPKGYDLDAGGGAEEGLIGALNSHREIELARGYTLFGPHVDDFKFLADGRDIRQFGSEGEQRTGVLALRCAEVHAMSKSLGRYPIVLLDDVFAELDEARAEALTALISRFDQIILTSSRSSPLADEAIHRITINGGRIE
jgi:DNA replication and repair protein RecF